MTLNKFIFDIMASCHCGKDHVIGQINVLATDVAHAERQVENLRKENPEETFTFNKEEELTYEEFLSVTNSQVRSNHPLNGITSLN